MTAEGVASTLLRVGFWVPLAFCTYLAFTPSPPESVFRISDIALHGFAFTYLTFSLGLAHRLRRWWQVGVWMFVYGLLIVIVQSFEPQRSAELKDLVVDCVGIALGLLGFALAGERVRSMTVDVTRALGR